MPRSAQQRDRDHEGGRVPRDQARLPRRADQRGLLRAAPHRRPAQHVPLRALPAARVRMRGRGELAHRGGGLHRAGAARSPTICSRRPPAPSGNLTLGGYDPLKERHYIMYVFSGGGYGGQPRGRRAHERLLDHRHLEDAADRGAGAALPVALRALRAARALGRRRQDARRLRRRLPDPHPPRRGACCRS